MKSKILYILPSEEIGGTEKMLIVLAKKIKEFGFEVVVLTLQRKGTFHRMLESNSIKTYSLNIKKMPVNAFIKTLFVFLKEKPCIIHSFLFAGNLFAKFLRIFFWIPVVCSQRSTDDWKKPFHWRLEKLTDFLCCITISNSKAGKKVLIEKAKISPKKVMYIPNGIELNQIKEKLKFLEKTSHKEILIGSVGNLRKAKGYEYLIDAAAIVCNKTKNVKFLILGKGPLEDFLKEKIKKLGLEENIILCGFVDDVYNYMVNFDIVVISSLWEGFPVVALEAMACGKPVIATNVGDLPEIVINGITGIIVEPEKPDQLAQAILELIVDKEKRENMGKKALEQVERFSHETMVRRYCEIYKTFIKI